MKERIYIKKWLEQKPYDTQTVTDSYYLKLSNNIKTVFKESDFIVLRMYLNEDEIDLMCCFLASYFEDIISETNIWNSFLNKHSKLYNKKLPFYNTDEYYENEINEQDISFLIWYFLNTIQEKKFIIPFNNFIIDIAAKVLLIFEKEYEYAPENRLLKSFYKVNQEEDDYYKVRNFIDTILFRTYLFYPDTALKMKQEEKKIIEGNGENLISYLQENRDSFLHQNCTRLLSMKGKEWGAEILGKNHPLYADLLNMSQRVRGFFLYKGQNENHISLEHIATGKKLKLSKKSFDNYTELSKIDTIVFIGMIQWQDEWWFSGIYFQTEFNADLILDEKKSIESRMVMNFLNHKKENINDLLQKQKEAFLSFNNGSLITFMPSDKLDDFMKDFIEYYNNTLNLSEKEKKQAEDRVKKDGFFDKIEDKKIDFTEIPETGLFYFNPSKGGEIAIDINSAFPLKENPYFDEQESKNAVLHLFLSEEFSKELAMYCIDNCKSNLSFFKEGVGKRYLKNIDFLLRFWKKENYHSTPAITYTGQIEKERTSN